MDWIPLVSLVITTVNGTVTIYLFKVNHREPPYKGKHRKKPKKWEDRHR